LSSFPLPRFPGSEFIFGKELRLTDLRLALQELFQLGKGTRDHEIFRKKNGFSAGKELGNMLRCGSVKTNTASADSELELSCHVTVQ
jgi:hypothetical protein